MHLVLTDSPGGKGHVVSTHYFVDISGYGIDRCKFKYVTFSAHVRTTAARSLNEISPTPVRPCGDTHSIPYIGNRLGFQISTSYAVLQYFLSFDAVLWYQLPPNVPLLTWEWGVKFGMSNIAKYWIGADQNAEI